MLSSVRLFLLLVFVFVNALLERGNAAAAVVVMVVCQPADAALFSACLILFGRPLFSSPLCVFFLYFVFCFRFPFAFLSLGAIAQHGRVINLFDLIN